MIEKIHIRSILLNFQFSVAAMEENGERHTMEEEGKDPGGEIQPGGLLKRLR